MEKLNPKEALDRLMHWCSQGEKSEKQVIQKLKSWHLDDLANSMLKFLKKENYLNELRFATAFTRDKSKFNKWGLVKIRYLLKMEGLTDAVITEAFSQLDYPEYRKMVKNELARKQKTIQQRDPWKRNSALYSFARQRGYESELVKEFTGSAEPESE